MTDAPDAGAVVPAHIALRQVEMTYSGDSVWRALQPTDLSIRRGEFVSVMGPSGSGKSTLLNILGLLRRPTSGRYLLDGIDTAALNDRDVAAIRGRTIGFVFQSFHLMGHRSALENVLLPLMYTGVLRRRRPDIGRELLAQVGLGERMHIPTRVLSGGERQRVAIARALVNRPPLLLCDEPTGNLDSRNAVGVMELLDGLHRDGLTVVVVTHDPGVAGWAGRRVTILDGRVSTDDSFAPCPGLATAYGAGLSDRGPV